MNRAEQKEAGRDSFTFSAPATEFACCFPGGMAANCGSIPTEEHRTRTIECTVPGALNVTRFSAFAEHRELQPASCSFLQASECDHICSRPRRSAMATACARSLAPSLPTRFLMWKLTVVSAIAS